MNIGTAIKTLRKQRGISQKEFAKMCDLSVNALCQIEVNNSFPQKSTIQDICRALSIPSAYLLFFSITDEDIPEDKKSVFNTLSGTLKDLLLEELKAGPDKAEEPVENSTK